MTETIAIVGAGTMGSGIAQNALTSGYSVILMDRHAQAAEAGLAKVRAGLDKAVAKGMLTDVKKSGLLAKIRISEDFSDAKDAIVVIEAIFENIEAKSELFKVLEEKINYETVIASNTSSISITKLGSGMQYPERLVGLHFFNPVPLMKLVEVVRGKKTSQQTMEKAKTIATNMGKTPVEVNDSPGFISNRILMPFINEAVLALENNVATKEGIDTIAKLGFNHPMGPIELADLIGLDVCRDILDAIYQQTGDQKFKPAGLLAKMVEEGKLGRKTGTGFYEYKK